MGIIHSIERNLILPKEILIIILSYIQSKKTFKSLSKLLNINNFDYLELFKMRYYHLFYYKYKTTNMTFSTIKFIYDINISDLDWKKLYLNILENCENKNIDLLIKNKRGGRCEYIKFKKDTLNIAKNDISKIDLNINIIYFLHLIGKIKINNIDAFFKSKLYPLEFISYKLHLREKILFKIYNLLIKDGYYNQVDLDTVFLNNYTPAKAIINYIKFNDIKFNQIKDYIENYNIGNTLYKDRFAAIFYIGKHNIEYNKGVLNFIESLDVDYIDNLMDNYDSYSVSNFIDEYIKCCIHGNKF